MNTFNPFASLNPYQAVSVHGHGTMLGATLEMPTDRVRDLLPHGLELGDQNLTAPGTHPVIHSFNQLIAAHLSVPSLMPSLTYNEHILGVPFVYLSTGVFNRSRLGPFYYMPRLHLDNLLATLSGIVYWGYAKEVASFSVTKSRYAVISSLGTTRTALDFELVEEREDFASVDRYPEFSPIRQLLDQPLISMLPLAMGPFFAGATFEKLWETARIRPLRTSLEINEAYLPSLEPGNYAADGINVSKLGSYELRSQIRLSMPYPLFASSI